MLSRPWMARFAVIAALCASCWAAVAPGAQAAAPRLGAVPGGIRAAAAQPAPLIPDSGPARRSKKGLGAPAMSASMARANARKQALARRIMHVMTGAASPDGKCASASCRAGLPVARHLAASQQAQILDYFCGPATVSEMLAQVGKKLSQQRVAGELGTTPDGTDWSNGSGYPVPNVLNKNQHRNVYVAVGLPWTPTPAQTRTYQNDLVTDINHNGGVPLGGNAYEVAGGPHLAGNPADSTIFHWFDIRGYQNSGAVTNYEDSVHGASSIGWSGTVPAYSSMSSAVLVEILGARGYIW
jgi:hypothetical protein